jgi:hypothetical protein
MQVAIDPDKPAFSAFLNYFLGQFPENDDGASFDIFFAKLIFLGSSSV